MCDTWNKLIEESEPHLNKRVLWAGKEYIFYGLVHGEHDYYYGLIRTVNGEITNHQLLSCVGNFESHEVTILELVKADDPPEPPPSRLIKEPHPFQKEFWTLR